MRKPRHWPGLRRIAGAAGLGLAMAAGQAPLSLWWVALPALAGLIWLVSKATAGAQGAAGTGWWLGWFAGAGYFIGSLNWIYEPFLVDAEAWGWAAPFAVVLIGFGLGLFWGAAGWLAGRLRLGSFGLAGMLALAELARSYVLTGFPWALIGHIWIETPVAQGAALVGPLGLTLGTTLAAAGLARMRALPSGLALAVVAAAWGWGSWRLAQPDPQPSGAVIRLVQPNAEQSLKWDRDAAAVWFERLLDFSAEPGQGPARPDLVVWPETALPYLLDRSPELAGIIANAAGGVPVALGLQRLEDGRGYNSLAVIGPDGGITGRYDKWHLVPFGEYIPLGDLAWRWFGIGAFASQLGAGYTPGPGPALLDLGPGLGQALPLICYEAVFPQDLRAAPGRADWILQITNDAWFGMLTGPWQHLAQVRLRAIEQGLPVARAANTGISAMIDAKGRITAELGLGQAGWLDAALPGRLPPTLYARTGDIPAGIAILFTIAGAFWRDRRRHSAA